MAHAFNSPSGMPAAMLCNIKPWREREFPETTNDAADEGTAAHFLMEQCLIQNCEAAKFIGCSIDVGDLTQFHAKGVWPVGRDMAHEVQKALDVLHSVSDCATIYPEQTLSIEFITGEEGATGTSDAVVIKGNTAFVFDLKYGRGVQVFAEGNEQLLMYGASAVADFDALGEIEQVELHILQPRLNHFDVWKLSVEEMNERIEVIRQTSKRILAGPEGLTAVPGEKQCRFCKASATCPERTAFTMETIVGEFVDLDKGFIQVSVEQAEKLLAQSFGVKPAAVDYQHNEDDQVARFVVKKPSIRPLLEEAIERVADLGDQRLATLMDACDMLESFPKAVRAEVERRLLAGKFTDARYKLVEGRMGNREFEDEEVAEAEMKAMRLKVDEMYNKKLISAPQAEKLLKESNPRKWAKLQKLIVQRQGKPSVAPASDKRPALSMAIAEQFEELPAEVEEFQSGASMIVEALVAVEQESVAEDNFDDLV